MQAGARGRWAKHQSSGHATLPGSEHLTSVHSEAHAKLHIGKELGYSRPTNGPMGHYVCAPYLSYIANSR